MAIAIGCHRIVFGDSYSLGWHSGDSQFTRTQSLGQNIKNIVPSAIYPTSTRDAKASKRITGFPCVPMPRSVKAVRSLSATSVILGAISIILGLVSMQVAPFYDGVFGMGIWIGGWVSSYVKYFSGWSEIGVFPDAWMKSAISVKYCSFLLFDSTVFLYIYIHTRFVCFLFSEPSFLFFYLIYLHTGMSYIVQFGPNIFLAVGPVIVILSRKV